MVLVQVNLPIHQDEEFCRYILSSVAADLGALAIRESSIQGAGTGLFTTRDVADGELLFTSSPLVSCAETRNSLNVCDFCYRARRNDIHPDGRFLEWKETLPALKLCTGCRLYKHCSDACQAAAWTAYHEHECKLLTDAPAEVETRALYRLLVLIEQKRLSEQQLEALFRLQQHHGKFRQGKGDVAYGTIQQIANEAKARTGSSLAVIDIEQVYCMLRINSMGIEQIYATFSGITLDLATSLINHSCIPNVVVVINHGRLETRSLQALGAGEELLHCYRDIAFDCIIRQPRLATKYLFWCKCGRCEAEIGRHMKAFSGNVPRLQLIHQSQLRFLSIIHDGMDQALQAVGGLDMDGLVASINELVESGYAGDRWPDDMEPLPMAWKTLARLCHAQGEEHEMESLKLRVKGCVATKQRRGLPWVDDMLDLASSLSSILTAPQPRAGHRGTGVCFLKRREQEDLLMGYLRDLLVNAEKTLGSGAMLSRAIRKWFEAEAPGYNGPGASTRAFKRRFKVAHAKLLTWAGVDARLWVVGDEMC